MFKPTPLVLVAVLLSSTAQAGKTTEARSQDLNATVTQIAAARYSPPGTYMKDHCLFRKDGKWHLFAPLGRMGTMWQHVGSEESAEHMVSDDLIHWQQVATAVPASNREEDFDRLMGGLAPHVVTHDGTFFMFYAGWTFRSKEPLDRQGFRQGIGVALSQDLVRWEKPAAFAQSGLGPKGSDQCVVRDEAQQRWLMFLGRPGAVFVYQSQDLLHWAEAGFALRRAELSSGKTDMNPGESPFVMRHPRSGKWIIFMNGGYSVSDDPLKFPQLQPYPFKAGIFRFPGAHDEGQGTFYYADDDGAGFAHEIIECNGQWYMTGVVGLDGHTRLKFTPIAWTEDAVALAPVIDPSSQRTK